MRVCVFFWGFFNIRSIKVTEGHLWPDNNHCISHYESVHLICWRRVKTGSFGVTVITYVDIFKTCIINRSPCAFVLNSLEHRRWKKSCLKPTCNCWACLCNTFMFFWVKALFFSDKQTVYPGVSVVFPPLRSHAAREGRVWGIDSFKSRTQKRSMSIFTNSFS